MCDNKEQKDQQNGEKQERASERERTAVSLVTWTLVVSSCIKATSKVTVSIIRYAFLSQRSHGKQYEHMNLILMVIALHYIHKQTSVHLSPYHSSIDWCAHRY